jgi:predicted membrane protein
MARKLISVYQTQVKIKRRKAEMLETIIIILLVLWLLGMVSGQSLGGMLWMLLVVAAMLFIVRLLTGRRTV